MKLFTLSIAAAFLFSGCKKTGSTNSSITKHLFANADADTTICMPYGGTGDHVKSPWDY